MPSTKWLNASEMHDWQRQHICGRAFTRHPQKAKKPPSGGIFYYFLAFLYALSRIIASISCATALTLPTAKSGGFLLQPSLPTIDRSYTMSTSVGITPSFRVPHGTYV